MKMLRLMSALVVRSGLIGLSVRARLPCMTALLARGLSRDIDRGSRFNVLCIGRPIFDEDIAELAEFGRTLNYVIVPKFVFINIFNCFLPQLLECHATYHEIDGYDQEKIRCRTFLRDFLDCYSRLARIDAILTANYNYSWQQELALAAHSRGIPFVVLFKEGISPLFTEAGGSQKAYDLMVAKYTNNRFIGDRLLVYNDRIKTAFLRMQIAGIGPDTVETVGIPRFDRYFHLDAGGRNVVFFSFNFEDKARHLGLEPETLEKYLTMTREFHAEVMRFAALHPELRVIVKTKNNLKYLRYVEDIAAETGCAELANLTLTNSGNVYDLLKDAHAVIGYNSTALLEAFAARRVVMSADFRWGPVCDYFDEFPGLQNYVTTAEDIAAILAAGHKGKALDDLELHSLLHGRLHTPDGQASVRTEKVIERTILMCRST